MSDSRFSGGKIVSISSEKSRTLIVAENPETGQRTTHVVGRPLEADATCVACRGSESTS